MFETAELGQEIAREEYDRRVPALREALLIAQDRLRDADFPVLVVFGGVDGAGKGDAINRLNEWLDPRWLYNRAFDEPTQDELERPEFWRFWRDLPGRGQIGLLSSTWYSRPLLERVLQQGSAEHFDARLDEILAFETTLAVDGALIVKFWLHLGKQAQEKRFRELEADPLQRWRVTERDWKNWERYHDFVAAGERLISRTSTGHAAWHIVEGWDACYRDLRVGELLLEALETRLEQWKALRETHAAAKLEAGRAPGPAAEAEQPKGPSGDADGGAAARVKAERPVQRISVLSRMDMSQKLPAPEYRERLDRSQGRLNRLQRTAKERGVSSVIVFEGWDASGKGGAIRRINAALDSRWVRVHPIAAPTDEERAHHYLWRFWRHLPRAGHTAIFDRSWYGRVLVERVDGFAAIHEWQRAYAEINAFEEQMVAHGIVLLKFFIHLDRDVQRKRFKQRAKIPYKSHKLTPDDWHNRKNWVHYERAVHDMVEQTSTQIAPWNLIEGNEKRFARIKILETIGDRLEEKLA